MGRLHVYAGPSLPAAEAARLLPDAVVHPPVSAGDLLSLDAGPDDTVAILDGHFLQTRSVRHKEILVLLERGVAVWGAASMGALRGAELHRYGMRTHGLVARLFRLGALVGDDEVTVLHTDASDGCRPLSEALVNIRMSLRRHARERAIGRADVARVVEVAAALPFGERRWERVLRDAGGPWARTELDGLVRGAPPWRVDQKRADAVSCLARLASDRERRDGAGRRVSAVPRTIWLAAWEREAVGVAPGSPTVSAEEALGACQLLGVDYPDLARDVALRWVASSSPAASTRPVTEAAAAAPGGTGSAERSPALCDAVRGVAAARGLLDPDVQRRWLTSQEAELGADERLIRVLARTFWVRPGVPARAAVIGRLVADGSIERAREVVLLARDANRRLAERDDRFSPHRLDAARVARWYLASWGVAGTESPALAMADRGFRSVGEVVAAGRALYAWARTEGASAEPLRLTSSYGATDACAAVTAVRFSHSAQTGP
ncbi:MAG TPA: TfuA-like protein [Candidatus Dormibacteraeota bacterium]|nr:TfuA-like protein [Candidatus Dormibacteraeota bacterium]